FFHVNELGPLILLICLLQLVGRQIAGSTSIFYRCARGFGAVTFLLYAGFGIEEWKPRTASQFFIIGVQAVLAMGTMHGLAIVILPFLHFLYEHLWARPLKRRRFLDQERALKEAIEKQELDAAASKQAASEELKKLEQRRRDEEARRPPPPTREESLAAARDRHDRTVQLLESANLDEAELRAARNRAKQQYLREIDSLL
ncbi:MAG TPA: hypothetical protein VE988_02760, partial [Gemmataceae bacterium]|nr:hypothetical protein [Gemmataceae bacterium]